MTNPLLKLRSNVLLGAAGVSFLAAGGLAAGAALSQGRQPQQPSRTVTVDVGRGEQGPPGPQGPQGERGEQGPPGGQECPDGFEFGVLVINHPGGHVSIYTCLEEE